MKKSDGIEQWFNYRGILDSSSMCKICTYCELWKELFNSVFLQEYEKYRVKEDKNYVSDFDREIKKILKLKN